MLPQSVTVFIPLCIGIISYFGLPKSQCVSTRSGPRPFVTAFRSSLMLMTVVSILAVDFGMFPRRFAKTEAYGVSVMDAGVGATVFGMGLLFGMKSGHADKSTLQRSLLLLAIGLARSMLIRWMDYQMHVTEYGVHWNFFFTLSAVSLAGTLLSELVDKRWLWTIGLGVVACYEVALSLGGLATYIMADSRSTLLDMNKEGLLSCFGYAGIYLIATKIGIAIKQFTNESKLCNRLTLLSVLFYALFNLTCDYLKPSRRMANIGYCIWIIALCTGHLAAFLKVELLAAGHMRSVILDAINANMFPVFLLGNVFTGVINVAMQTLLVSNAMAITTVFIYTAALVFLAMCLPNGNGPAHQRFK